MTLNYFLKYPMAQVILKLNLDSFLAPRDYLQTEKTPSITDLKYEYFLALLRNFWSIVFSGFICKKKNCFWAGLLSNDWSNK